MLVDGRVVRERRVAHYDASAEEAGEADHDPCAYAADEELVFEYDAAGRLQRFEDEQERYETTCDCDPTGHE